MRTYRIPEEERAEQKVSGREGEEFRGKREEERREEKEGEGRTGKRWRRRCC